MSDIRTVSAEAGLTLLALNTVVSQNEAALGRLVVIGNDGHKTTLSFDLDPPLPTASARIVKGSVAGAETTGAVFIDGMQTPASVVRP